MIINDNLLERETIKLIKNSRGYTWEIKVNAIELTEITIDELKGLDNYMKKTFETRSIDEKEVIE
jgi:hypothetical protein